MTNQLLSQERFKKLQAQPDKISKLIRYKGLNPYVRPGQILFAGSSLMEGFPIEEFQLGLGLPKLIYNRGVGGFTTTEMMDFLDICVYELKPSRIFLNIGTNDMNPADYRVEDLIGRYEKIVTDILHTLPDVKITLLAYYPVNHAASPDDSWFFYRTNARILEANQAVQALAQRHCLDYLDLNAPLLDADGNLKAEYTMDGVHMYPGGYWAVLEEFLKNTNPQT